MKLNGQRPQGLNVVIIALPRQNEAGEPADIIFKAQAIPDFKEFDALVPTPQPPMIKRRGSPVDEPDPNHPAHREAMNRWAEFRSQWIVVKSLAATPGLEWERVKPDEPDTWKFWKEELQEAGITEVEMIRIMSGVMEANSMSEKMIEEARARFLASQRQG